MTRICLSAIVRNEIKVVPRMLKSMVGHITAAVILDTGSTDGTQDFIKAFCKQHDIQCRVIQGIFKNFEQARNDALTAAHKSPFGWDYLILCDADMELKVNGPLPHLTSESYTLLQRQGGLAYHNVRLLRKGSKSKYHGVTHEYLAVDQQEKLPGDVWWFQDTADGNNRVEKYARDTRLLEGYLADHPGDGRSLFYLAQTYRDMGDHKKAIELYQKRIEVGGWDEEIWYAHLQVARSYRSLGMEKEFISSALDAYNARPSRAEPLYDLARYYREKNDHQQAGWLFAEAGSKVAYPLDLLFVEQALYDWGFLEEKSILGAYNDNTKLIGFGACDKISLMNEAPDSVREGARRNLFWYLEPLVKHAPSFKAVKIPQLNNDPVYTNSNPSVAVVNGNVKAIVRTVSYRIRPDGTYDYNGLAAIRTTNFLVNFNPALEVFHTVELQRPTGFPEPVFKDVLDVEDMRLIPWNGELWANGCVLEQNPEAWREQFIMKLNPDTGEVTDCHKIDPAGNKQNEKNWMPVLDYGLMKWMYRPGYIMHRDGQFSYRHDPKLAIDQFSGGGQVIPFDAGWVAIIHEARPDPTNGKRYYQHRFVWFDDEYRLQKVSRPFVFFDRQIEFAAGLARHPVTDDFIVSFGVLDREAWLGTLCAQDVREMIWHP